MTRPQAELDARWRDTYGERNQHIAAMYQAGMSAGLIAHEFCMSSPGVRVILIRLGITLRHEGTQSRWSVHQRHVSTRT